MRYNQLAAAISVMFSAVATANQISVEQVSRDFAVSPNATQKMYEEIALSSEFLQKINIVGKVEKVGEVIGLSAGLIGSNTDTRDDAAIRKPRSIHSLSKRQFNLEKTNFDVRLRYEEIDAWAHVAHDFPAKVNKKVAESIAISLITVGLRGEKRTANSDFAANPMLQDVAKGWLQNAAPVKYGPGGSDYKNLDAVVTDVLNEMIDERFADRTDFVVLASRRTVGDKYLRIINAGADQATEIEAGGRLNQKRTLGGLPVMYVPNMPADTLLITPLSNLSIYYQIGGERRHIKDVPEKDQLESYQSKNIDYIVEEYGAAVLVEHLRYTEA